MAYADERALPAADRPAVFAEYVGAVRAALADSDFARAHELATQAVRVFPNSRRAWNHLAAARLRLGQWGPAIEAARRGESAEDQTWPPAPTPEESFAGSAYWEGVALYATQRYDEAVPRLRAARTRAPQWAEAARALAECIFVKGDARAAAADYAAAFALDPTVGTARDLSYYAEAQAAAGDVAGGVAAIQEALRRAPYESGLHAKLGDLLRREGRLADAYYELVYEVVLHGLESDFSQAAVSMQDALVRDLRKTHVHHEGTDAATETHATQADADAHEIVVVASGLQSLDGGATHRAVKQFQHALNGTRSVSPIPHLLFADALLRASQPDHAGEVLDALLRAQPDCVPALYLLADVQQASGRAAEAAKTRARVGTLYPGYWRLRAKAPSG
jgi:tetratricopeptide (TPR) repeat protein